MDKLKKKAEELDLDAKARQLQEAATQAAKQAREKAGDFAVENRDKIDGYVETASAKIDEKTEGKYSDKVAKVREQVDRGVDKVAEGHTSGPTTATGAAAAAGATDVTGGQPFPVDPDAPTPVTASPLEAPSPIERPTPVHESGYDAAAGDVPVPVQEALSDTTLEDTVLGLDHPPTAAGAHHDGPTPEDADAAPRVPEHPRDTHGAPEGTS
ncbi:antitoxin [Terrabacter aerolatus]|nr:antitoxin [Terrabacter aerolatus]